MPDQPKYEVMSAEMYPSGDGFVIHWSAKNMGFGILVFKRDEDGKHSIDTEMMSKEFCAAVLMKLLDNSFTNQRKY